MRVVLDTNVLVSLVLGGILGILADYWDNNRFRVVVTTAIMAEYATVLARPKFGLPREFVVPAETIEIITIDPKDNMFLECAVAGQVDLIVSGDPHLNALKTFRGISILTPRDFLKRSG